ncbi:hypothetical protein AB0M35_23520 [Micromonospora sp. NPDC051196]|uniref:hypothetical protein n=1 Tax=Micromonospora sp. NPDC051196 TaxID=3155281 RepID=UPI00343190E3
MPTFAFSRPLWPVTRCALTDLTRLALVALILAVGLGGATGTDPARLPDATDFPAPPAAALVDNRPVVAPLAARSGTAPLAAGAAAPLAARAGTAPVVTVRPVATSVQVPVQPVRALATAVAPHPGPADAAAPAAATRPVAVHLATGAGEPTRRGPPTD